jgi:hypothetical protein
MRAQASNREQLKTVPGVEGGVVASVAFPWFTNDTPATAEFQAAMKRYLPGVLTGGANSVGWVAAKLFERAASGMPEPPTAAAVLQGLWNVHGDDLGGLTYALDFNQGKPTTERICWFNVRIRQGQYEAPNGTKSHCR